MVLTQVGKFALLRQIGLYPFMDGVSRLDVTTGSPIWVARAFRVSRMRRPDGSSSGNGQGRHLQIVTATC
jgi:hypothetical protein